MSVVALTAEGDSLSVLTERQSFDPNGKAILIVGADQSQLSLQSADCNISYDLRVGELYRDHRYKDNRTIGDHESIAIQSGMAVIIQTLEEVVFPKWRFGQIVPKVSLLQEGLANTPTKIDPGYSGKLLITVFNHGKLLVELGIGKRFCSMFVLTVEGAIRPYNKPGKHLTGRVRRDIFRKLMDKLEARPTLVSAGIALIAVAVSIVALFK
jgi:dCTP deaminase